MDTASTTALAAALAALPTSAFLIVIIIVLWRRLNAVTDLLIEAKAAKTDDATKLQDSSPKANPTTPPLDD